MAYTYDITTDIGKVRLLIGDTDVTPTTDAQFNDEELQIFLDLGGSVFMGAAKALEAWAGRLSGDLLSEHIFNRATRISASVRDISGGDNVKVWIEIQEI